MIPYAFSGVGGQRSLAWGPAPNCVHPTQELLQQLGRLNQELNAPDPQIDKIMRRDIQAAIGDVNAERDRLRGRALQLGC
jgi:hypothetical protein